LKIYTRKGDDGTTGLLFGGRVSKDDPAPAAYGDADEAQSVLGLVRAESPPAGELHQLVLGLQRDLWVLMAELATDPANRGKLTGGQTLVTAAMVQALEGRIDELSGRFEPPTEFVVPGTTRLGALLDVARCVVRRAERSALRAAPADSHVVPYLNRLSDLLWTMARWQEGSSLRTREV
jgi:cob(I)alamin adenosyltransferase